MTYRMNRRQVLRHRLYQFSLRLSCWLFGEHRDVRPDPDGAFCWACGA